LVEARLDPLPWLRTKAQQSLRRLQPKTVEERIELAHELRRRFRLSTSMLIDALDNRAWRAFGSAPNVAMLVHPDGRIAVKQGWFQPQEMARAITALLKNSLVTADYRMSHHG
jgi:hypothetical protein